MEILALLGSAVLLGLSSSGHCLLMCGPIQGAWISSKKPHLYLLYHLGRTLSYITIALLFRKAALLVALPNWAAQSTLLLGLSLLFGVVFYFLVEFLLPNSWTKPLVRLGSVAGRFPIMPRSFFLGLINGWLPCGMVWMAAAMAIPTENTVHTVLIMVAFSIGTQPALLGVPLIQQLYRSFQNRVGGRWSKLTLPVIILILGAVLTFRGYSYGKDLAESDNAHSPEKLCAPHSQP